MSDCPAVTARQWHPALQRIDSARVEEVIHVQMLRGYGKSDADPVRYVHQYWSREGRLLAEFDSFAAAEGVVGP